MTEKCGNCKFFNKTSVTDGKCHRFPPKPYKSEWATGGRTFGVQPTTYADAWCGEFRPYEAKDEKTVVARTCNDGNVCSGFASALDDLSTLKDLICKMYNAVGLDPDAEVGSVAEIAELTLRAIEADNYHTGLLMVKSCASCGFTRLNLFGRIIGGKWLCLKCCCPTVNCSDDILGIFKVYVEALERVLEDRGVDLQLLQYDVLGPWMKEVAGG